MGATRPNAKQMAYAHARIVSGWSDPRGMYMSDDEKNRMDSLAMMAIEPKTGYNPKMKRWTCFGCNSLTWHHDGKCTECGHE